MRYMNIICVTGVDSGGYCGQRGNPCQSLYEHVSRLQSGHLSGSE